MKSVLNFFCITVTAILLMAGITGCGDWKSTSDQTGDSSDLPVIATAKDTETENEDKNDAEDSDADIRKAPEETQEREGVVSAHDVLIDQDTSVPNDSDETENSVQDMNGDRNDQVTNANGQDDNKIRNNTPDNSGAYVQQDNVTGAFGDRKNANGNSGLKNKENDGDDAGLNPENSKERKYGKKKNDAGNKTGNSKNSGGDNGSGSAGIKDSVNGTGNGKNDDGYNDSGNSGINGKDDTGDNETTVEGSAAEDAWPDADSDENQSVTNESSAVELPEIPID